MNVTLLPEPELQFGNNGRHVDIRFGIRNPFVDFTMLLLRREAFKFITIAVMLVYWLNASGTANQLVLGRIN